MNQKTKVAILLCFLGPLLLSSICVAGRHKAERAYNGIWWLERGTQEQSGFLNGYLDCYTYEYKGGASFTRHPPAIAIRLVTKFYKDNPSRLNDLVANVFFRLRDHVGAAINDRHGEPIAGAHGFYRGLYWRQISIDPGPEMEERGFVEGFLVCHSLLDHDRGGTFSKPASEYVKLISEWYGFNPATGDIDASREPTPIAEVLFMFRDQLAPQKDP